jgi:hypothetical protein
MSNVVSSNALMLMDVVDYVVIVDASSQICRLHGFISFKHECHALFKHRTCVHDFLI